MQSKHNELVGDAGRQEIDRDSRQLSETERQCILNDAAGLWRDRDDLPDWHTLRASWDRKIDE